MAKHEKAKLIMELHAKKMSVREIARTRHVSAHTVKGVLDRAKEKGLSWENAAHLSAEEIASMLYPEDRQAQEALVRPDYGYVHDGHSGRTRCRTCRNDGMSSQNMRCGTRLPSNPSP